MAAIKLIKKTDQEINEADDFITYENQTININPFVADFSTSKKMLEIGAFACLLTINPFCVEEETSKVWKEFRRNNESEPRRTIFDELNIEKRNLVRIFEDSYILPDLTNSDTIDICSTGDTIDKEELEDERELIRAYQSNMKSFIKSRKRRRRS